MRKTTGLKDTDVAGNIHKIIISDRISKLKKLSQFGRIEDRPVFEFDVVPEPDKDIFKLPELKESELSTVNEILPKLQSDTINPEIINTIWGLSPEQKKYIAFSLFNYFIKATANRLATEKARDTGEDYNKVYKDIVKKQYNFVHSLIQDKNLSVEDTMKLYNEYNKIAGGKAKFPTFAAWMARMIEENNWPVILSLYLGLPIGVISLIAALLKPNILNILGTVGGLAAAAYLFGIPGLFNVPHSPFAKYPKFPSGEQFKKTVEEVLRRGIPGGGAGAPAGGGAGAPAGGGA